MQTPSQTPMTSSQAATIVSAVFEKGQAELTLPQNYTLGDLAIFLSLYAEQSGDVLKRVTITRH